MKNEKSYPRILSNKLSYERGKLPLVTKKEELTLPNPRYQKEELEGTRSSNQDNLLSPGKTNHSIQKSTQDQMSPEKRTRMLAMQEKLTNLEMKLAQERLTTKPSLETEPFEMHLTLEDENNEDVLLKWCPFCRKESVMMKKYKNSSKTFWASVAILFTGGVLGCFLLPYASNNCKQSYQVCSKCNHSI